MYATKEDTLSPDEMRKRLFQTFKNKGVLDTLKTQLRNQIIHQLKPLALTGGEPVPRPVSVKSEPLLVSACNSMVADHLSTSGYEYTLSVFYPESSLCKEKVFAREDLLQLLRISPESALYKSLSSNKDSNDKGFLISLLSQLTHHHTPGRCRDADTQTTSTAGHGESLVEKMKMIDKEYENFSYSGGKWFSVQSNMAAYKKEMEAQLQAEMNTELQHFKDVEIAKVRMEEKSKFHKEFDKLKQELERTYEVKTKALMGREKNAIDRLQNQQEIEEKNLYMQRQSLLKEIETLRNREKELRMRMEAFEKTCQMHEEKVKTTEELLRRRELAVKTMEDTYDQRLKNELSRYQLELKEDFIKRTEKLTENENRNKMETARIHRESAVIDSKLEEQSRARSELRRLQVELDTAQQQIPLLTQQRDLLRERLETMSDYPGLKREKAELQGQLRLLKTQLVEAQEENRLLHADLGKPSKEQLALQTELRRLQSARRLDEEEFDNQKQVLQAQLQSEVERCAQLKVQLMQCEEKSRWMKNHAEDVKTQLRQTQLALENEVLRNPKPSLVDRSVLELSADKLVPPDIYVDTAPLRARLRYGDAREAGGPPRGHGAPRSDSPDSDDAEQARLQELQREAETLEEAYRNYQQRAVHSTISHALPPRTLSPPQRRHRSHRANSPPRTHVSHRPHAQYPRKSHRPPSPRTLRTPSPSTFDARNNLTPAQPKVTFSEAQDLPQATVFTEHSILHSFTESLFQRDGHVQDESAAPSRRLSSTPHSSSSSRNHLQRETAEEAAASPVVSPVAFPELSPDGRLPRGPAQEAVTSGGSSSELSSPRSPQLQSTARDRHSPPKAQPVYTSSESSPQPDRISLGDLTGILSEPGRIPELLLDTAVPLTEEAPDGPAVPPRPQDLPEDPADSQGQAGAVGDSARDEDEEAEVQRWERERKERQERRQREQEEARERELQELERLEKNVLLQEVEQPGSEDEEEEEEEETGIKEGEDEEQKEDVEEAKCENPLEKYMKMVLEAKEKERAQNPGREEAGHTSPEAKSLSEEKENSIAAYSHKDEDDDVW